MIQLKWGLCLIIKVNSAAELLLFSEVCGMSRYILRYTGGGTPPAPDLDRIRTLPGLSVVDASSPQLYLIEATDAAARQVEEMPSWALSLERLIPLPDTRKKIRKSF